MTDPATIQRMHDLAEAVLGPCEWEDLPDAGFAPVSHRMLLSEGHWWAFRGKAATAELGGFWLLYHGLTSHEAACLRRQQVDEAMEKEGNAWRVYRDDGKHSWVFHRGVGVDLCPDHDSARVAWLEWKMQQKEAKP